MESGAAWGQAQGRWPELTAEMVKTSIARGTAYMATTQNENGSFGNGGLARGAYPVGPTALATLALLNSGVAPNDPVITRRWVISGAFTIRAERTKPRWC